MCETLTARNLGTVLGSSWDNMHKNKTYGDHVLRVTLTVWLRPLHCLCSGCTRVGKTGPLQLEGQTGSLVLGIWCLHSRAGTRYRPLTISY